MEPPLLTTTPHQREDVSALDRFNVHRCPTRWVLRARTRDKASHGPIHIPLGYCGCRKWSNSVMSSGVVLLKTRRVSSDREYQLMCCPRQTWLKIKRSVSNSSRAPIQGDIDKHSLALIVLFKSSFKCIEKRINRLAFF
ncbi:hypothetical protein TNCV_3856651 [Trichonephila clavipes]|nr:hypothetical protein TNCV_3856651 [Trichonephila clavipes]